MFIKLTGNRIVDVVTNVDFVALCTVTKWIISLFKGSLEGLSGVVVYTGGSYQFVLLVRSSFIIKKSEDL